MPDFDMELRFPGGDVLLAHLTGATAPMVATDPALTQSFPIRSRTLPDVPSTEETTVVREMSYNPQNWGINFDQQERILANQDRILNYLMAQEKAGIDPAKSAITLDGLRQFSRNADDPDLVPWIIPFYPPSDGQISSNKGTELALKYAIENSTKARIQIYGFANERLADAIVARIRRGGWDYQIAINHDGYMAWDNDKRIPGAKTTGETVRIIDSKNADGSWKYPEFHQSDRFVLMSSDYSFNQTTKVDGSRRILHRKCGSFDDQVMFTGSTNWGDSDNNKQAQELHFIAQAGVVAAHNKEFDRLWNINLLRGKTFYQVP